ncbi:sigma-54-dependent Fis family transcriptional regulator [uncultured Thiohalocapsa sp.]|uniref:sigma-54 interaction domain-containing protein n=1 Tax=uncultured Thiohalocapsa sp. TaxID=768990 RepID=UPI0025F40BB5|nr:sigma-54-dependent Fis family transcriptional regulator [uncultured Thiohalocapsa sp.]
MPDLVALRSLLETHERPFVVIAADRRVVAVNQAFERAFNKPGAALAGLPCHRVLHNQDRPCDETGEDCPFAACLAEQQPRSCLHTHGDAGGGTHWVRVNMYPIAGADGERYVGELVQEIAAREGHEEVDDTRPVGRSPAFLSVMEQLEQAARTDAPVLLVGETGTGKELAARFMHRYSPRRDRPFVAVDCSVIAESLFESELFGHERGAFTGSVQTRPGLIEIAGSGTVFLDEIAEASPSAQAKLLRVLEAREFRRVGGNKVIRTDARVICATNRDLWQLVEAGSFREDLYYRIACFRVRIPPLRERPQDVPGLADALLKRIGRAAHRRYHLDPEALRLLLAYDYPGNVRELRSVLQVAVAHLEQGHRGRVTADAVAAGLRMREHYSAAPVPQGRVAHRADREVAAAPPVCTPAAHNASGSSLDDVEAAYISGQLRRCGGNRRRVASALGISERTLYRKIAKYRLGDLGNA